MSKAASQDFHVLIIGAGTTGLAIAQGLKKNNISFTIYERVDADTYIGRTRDWTMGLHWGAQFLREMLPTDIAENLRKVEGDPWIEMSDELETKSSAHNGRTGEPLMTTSAPSLRRASRRKLRNLLTTGIDVHYGKRLVDIVDGDKFVTAIFDDGTRAVGSALIGCDSANSVVRRYVCPSGTAELETMPITLYNFSSRYDATTARALRSCGHPLIMRAPHPDQLTWFIVAPCDIADPMDPTTWKFHTLMAVWDTEGIVPASQQERRHELQRLAENYFNPMNQAVLAIPEETFIPCERTTHWANPVRWNNHEGRITLAGDAAHAMSPFRGQGLNNGLEDGAHYINAILTLLDTRNGKTMKGVIDEYDNEVFERGQKEIQVSAEQGYFSTHFEAYTKGHTAKHGMHKIPENTN